MNVMLLSYKQPILFFSDNTLQKADRAAPI